jgi:hypothetical protein
MIYKWLFLLFNMNISIRLQNGKIIIFRKIGHLRLYLSKDFFIWHFCFIISNLEKKLRTLSEFHRWTNLTAFLNSDFKSRNRTKYSENGNLEILGAFHIPYPSWWILFTICVITDPTSVSDFFPQNLICLNAIFWYRTTGQTPRQFLRRKLVEGPNNVFPWSADFKFRIYFVKLTSKFGKIELLDDPGGQGSSPKGFICRLHLRNGLRLRPRKEKSSFGCF